MKRVKLYLDIIAFLLTIIMVLYGLAKGFDVFELLTNVLYFTVMVIVSFLGVLEQIQKNN